MGVPKFFRWVSERYPLTTELINEHRIPEFDNLYLDMNGIIHVCSHPSDDVSFRISEVEIFLNIFRYIEYIFGKIRPTKMFFLAVDGVAPRAKMNQQRARRFRTAAEVVQKTEEARKRGLAMPDEPPFDSNCITPGTKFMAKLHEQLQYFLAKKITEDAAWRNVQVVLSGHDVPGEGEHKIMEYIRLAKSRPDYNPNVRHCLYGLDADLIMLGLLTHEPHFSLLREEVKFGLDRKSAKTSTNFFLLHLSLYREYLDMEFNALRPLLSFEYSLERVIDDYILMAFFVGNDFLPHLPGIHINEGAFELIFEAYKRLLPTLPGYLNQGGVLSLDRCEKLIAELADHESKNFARSWGFGDDGSTLGRGKRRNKAPTKKKAVAAPKVLGPVGPTWYQKLKEFVLSGTGLGISLDIPSKDTLQVSEIVKKLGLVFDVEMDKEVEYSETRSVLVNRSEMDDDSDDESFLAQKRLLVKYDDVFATLDPDAVDPETQETLDREVECQRAFVEWKQSYYKEKLEFNAKDDASVSQLVFHYVQGLQWVLFYYYRGVQSWEWFFPYHYAPKITDIVNISNLKFNFEKGRPFKPFEQLMGVLPPASKTHIPEVFRSLMMDLDSPIIDFYPLKFEMDANESKTPWEAVVKICFIEESRLLKAVEPRYKLLTEEERKRNSFGPSLHFSYSPNPTLFKSTLPDIFPDITRCNAVIRDYFLPVMGEDGFVNDLNYDALVGSKLLPGFPSLCTLPHHGTLGVHGIVVYGYPSKNPTAVITLQPTNLTEKTAEEKTSLLVGSQVYVGWPYLVEARIESIVDECFTYTLKKDSNGSNVTKEPLSDRDLGTFSKQAEEIELGLSKRFGVITGTVETIVNARTLTGMSILHDGSMAKVFSNTTTPFAVQTVVFGKQYEDLRYANKAPPPLNEEYPVGMVIFSVAPSMYGHPCKVMGYLDANRLKLSIRVNADPTCRAQPVITKELVFADKSEEWFSLKRVCKAANAPFSVVNRITSSLYIEVAKKRINIGLNLKFDNKGLKVVGYSQKTSFGWEFTKKAVDLIAEYRKTFPDLFTLLSKKNPEAMYECPDSFLGPAQIIDQWLQAKGVRSLVTCPLNQVALSTETIHKMEEAITDWNAKAKAAGYTYPGVSSTRGMVLKPSQSKYRLAHQIFDLGDRIVSASDEGAVPLGSYGTVVGVVDSIYVDVIFDENLLGGTDLNGKCSPGRGWTVAKETLLNLTNIQPTPSAKTELASALPSRPQHPFEKPDESKKSQPKRFDLRVNRPSSAEAPPQNHWQNNQGLVPVRSKGSMNQDSTTVSPASSTSQDISSMTNSLKNVMLKSSAPTGLGIVSNEGGPSVPVATRLPTQPRVELNSEEARRTASEELMSLLKPNGSVPQGHSPRGHGSHGHHQGHHHTGDGHQGHHHQQNEGGHQNQNEDGHSDRGHHRGRGRGRARGRGRGHAHE